MTSRLNIAPMFSFTFMTVEATLAYFWLKCVMAARIDIQTYVTGHQTSWPLSEKLSETGNGNIIESLVLKNAVVAQKISNALMLLFIIAKWRGEMKTVLPITSVRPTFIPGQLKSRTVEPLLYTHSWLRCFTPESSRYMINLEGHIQRIYGDYACTSEKFEHFLQNMTALQKEVKKNCNGAVSARKWRQKILFELLDYTDVFKSASIEEGAEFDRKKIRKQKGAYEKLLRHLGCDTRDTSWWSVAKFHELSAAFLNPLTQTDGDTCSNDWLFGSDEAVKAFHKFWNLAVSGNAYGSLSSFYRFGAVIAQASDTFVKFMDSNTEHAGSIAVSSRASPKLA